MSNISKIAVVGCEGVGKKSLIQQLTHTPYPNPSTSYTIDTKYYSARVQIHSFTLTAPHPPSFSPQDFEALILIYDLSVPNTLRQIQRFCDTQDLQNFELRFVVGNKADLVPHDVRHVQNVFSWCGENLMEYLQTSAVDGEFDQGIVIEEERSGVEQLERGLKAHMWKGLTLKNKNQSHSNSDGIQSKNFQKFDLDFSSKSHSNSTEILANNLLKSDPDFQSKLHPNSTEISSKNFQKFDPDFESNDNILEQSQNRNSEFSVQNGANSKNAFNDEFQNDENDSNQINKSEFNDNHQNEGNFGEWVSQTNIIQSQINNNNQPVQNEGDNSSQEDLEFGYQRLDGDEIDENYEMDQNQNQEPQHQQQKFQEQQQQQQQQQQQFQQQDQSIGPNLDEFERLMSEVSSARERFRDLPDDVRREAAAQLALQLAAAFGISDDEPEIEE